MNTPSKRWFGLVLALSALLPQICLSAQTPATRSTANQSIERAATMHTFVIIFRQGPHPLTDTDKQHRAAETGVWARHQNDAGHKLDPRILAPESEHRGPEEPTAASGSAWPVTALLFLEARDLNEAAQVAESHPALHYGASAEVRPWSPPVPVTPP